MSKREGIICPECEQGKHDNCTEDVLIEEFTYMGIEEEWIPCGCPCQAPYQTRTS